MAASLHSGIIPGAEAKKLYSYPTLTGSTDQYLNGKGQWAASANVTVGTASKLKDSRKIDGISFDGTADVTHYAICNTPATEAIKKITVPNFNADAGANFTLWNNYNNTATDTVMIQINDMEPLPLWDADAQVIAPERIKRGPYQIIRSASATSPHWVVVSGPEEYLATATATKQGAMAAADKAKLDTITGGIEAHPTFTKITGVPTANQTPAFGATFSVNQVARDELGHVSAITTRTVKIPNTAATASAAGLMSSAMYSSLTTAAAGVVSLKNIFDTPCTTEVDKNGNLLVKLSNGKTFLTIPKAGEY